MTKQTNTITDLQTLDQEILRLRLRAKELEVKIDDSLDYLQDHYSTMAMKSVLPFFSQKSGFAGSILQIFLQNDRIRDNLGKLAVFLLDKFSDGLEYLTNKLSPQKEDGV
jgi:hypothetical protein